MATLSAAVASCTAAGDPNFNLASPSFTNGDAGTDITVASETAQTSDDGQNLVMSTEGTTELPETVAYVPIVKPGGAFPEVQATATTEAAATGAVASTDSTTNPTSQAAQAAASDAQAQSAVAAVGDDQQQAAAKTQPAAVPADYPVYVTATDPNQATAPASQQKKRSFFSSLFGTTPANASPFNTLEPQTAATAETTPMIAPEPDPKPVATLASTDDKKAEVKVASLYSDEGQTEHLDALPGVRQSALFEIKRKSGIDDDSDVDLHEEDDYGPPVQVATAAGLARLAPNGLVTQTDQVDVACLKPSLVRVLKTVEQHYGRKVIVTSGYRSPAHNRRARGAKNSLHMYCAAADIQVSGVSKWELATYFRSMPGRGGVGTYCHTNSVHIDVGPERDWNWRCRRRKG